MIAAQEGYGQIRQRRPAQGFVAIVLLVTIALAAVSLFSKNLWGGDPQALQQKTTQDSLKKAKESVLNFVEIGFISNLGALTSTALGARLPCPDQNGDGAATAANDAPCGAAGLHSIGLLPWATLGIPPLRDSTHECLWYAVDGLFKVQPFTNAAPTPGTNVSPTITANADSFGSFSVIQPVKNNATGSWLEVLLAGNPKASAATDPNRVVAVIFAPGSPMGNQTRSTPATAKNPCATPTGKAAADVAQYLENYIGTSISAYNQMNPPAGLTAHIGNISVPNTQLNTFVQADTGQEKLNDQLIFITAEEFARAATKRVAQLYANALVSYNVAAGSYPSAAATPRGACVAGRLQGYVPYTCASGTVSLTLAASLNPDTDWWASQAHYAVSQDCILGGAAAPCHALGAGATTNVGGHGLILMRGRAQAGQTCTATSGAEPAPLDMSLCLEGLLNNAVVNTLPANAAGAARIGNAVFGLPPAGSNDYLVRLP